MTEKNRRRKKKSGNKRHPHSMQQTTLNISEGFLLLETYQTLFKSAKGTELDRMTRAIGTINAQILGWLGLNEELHEKKNEILELGQYLVSRLSEKQLEILWDQ